MGEEAFEEMLKKNASPSADSPPPATGSVPARSPPTSSFARRLREVLKIAHDDDDEDCESPPVASPSSSAPSSGRKAAAPSVRSKAPLLAACDEEIEDETGTPRSNRGGWDSEGVASEADPEEVEEHVIVHDDDKSSKQADMVTMPGRPPRPVEMRVDSRKGPRRLQRSRSTSRSRLSGGLAPPTH